MLYCNVLVQYDVIHYGVLLPLPLLSPLSLLLPCQGWCPLTMFRLSSQVVAVTVEVAVQVMGRLPLALYPPPPLHPPPPLSQDNWPHQRRRPYSLTRDLYSIVYWYEVLSSQLCY